MAPNKPNVQRIPKKRKAAAGLRVDGVEYIMEFGEVSATDAGALRAATGMTVAQLFATAQTAPDIDVVAAIVWLARRQNGEKHLAFVDVADEITWDSDIKSLDDDQIDEAAEAAPKA